MLHVPGRTWTSRALVRVTKTKNGKDRFVPMNEVTRNALLQLRPSLSSEGFIFVNPVTGKPFTDIKRAFHTACRLAGIKDFRFHDLRHTAATRLGDLGANEYQIIAMLGQSNVQTGRIYSHATIESLRRLTDGLAERRTGTDHGR